MSYELNPEILSSQDFSEDDLKALMDEMAAREPALDLDEMGGWHEAIGQFLSDVRCEHS